MEKILKNVKERKRELPTAPGKYFYSVSFEVLKKIKKTCLKKIKGRIELQIYVCEFICLFCCVALFHKEQLLAFFNCSRFAVLRGVHSSQPTKILGGGLWKAGI